jgi:phosphoadenosine phosphosulfate reductase
LKDIFKTIKTASQEIDEAVVMFSTGKDSIVTLDLCVKYLKKVVAVYLYFVKGISFRERILNHYRKRYGIEILQYPYPDVSRIINKGMYLTSNRKVTNLGQSDVVSYIRKQTGIEYVAFGYRINESLQRRAIVKKFSDNGIDHKYKKIYPIWDLSAKDCFNYIAREKLILPVEYQYGFRDISFYSGDSLIWLYQNYPKDYELVKRTYPFIDAELERAYERI